MTAGFDHAQSDAIVIIDAYLQAPPELISQLIQECLLIACGAFLYSIWVVYKTIRFGDPVRSSPSMVAIMTFLGEIQFSFIGVLGEYVGKMFNE